MIARRRRVAAVLGGTLVVAVGLVLASLTCGGDGRRTGATADTAALQSGAPRVDSQPTRTDSGTLVPPESLTVLPNSGPAFVLRADSAAGDEVFHRTAGCQTCHGNRGEGVPGLGPALNDAEWLHGDGSPTFIQGVVLAGIAEPKVMPRGMPSFATRLTPAQAAHAAAYVYSLTHGFAVVDSLPDAAPPPADTTVPP